MSDPAEGIGEANAGGVPKLDLGVSKNGGRPQHTMIVLMRTPEMAPYFLEKPMWQERERESMILFQFSSRPQIQKLDGDDDVSEIPQSRLLDCVLCRYAAMRRLLLPAEICWRHSLHLKSGGVRQSLSDPGSAARAGPRFRCCGAFTKSLALAAGKVCTSVFARVRARNNVVDVP